MAGDDLNDPLGTSAPRGTALRGLPYRAIALIGGVVATGLVAFFVVTSDPRSGEPYAIAAIDAPAHVAPTAAAVHSDPDATATIPRTGHPTSAEEAERASGVAVVRPGGGLPPDSLIIQVPQALGLTLTPAPDRRLTEKTRYGLIPRVGADGARARDVYARPVVTPASLPATAPRIALLVGGVGLSATASEDAIAKLPAAVTLGIAPYGADLDRLVARARARGHEVILQVPIESFDQGSSSPHILLSASGADRNVDDLHWFMGRFVGYVGIGNFLGAKFTADAAALTPVLREIAARGLSYVDDGSSPRSLATTLAPDLDLPTTRADLTLDGGGTTLDAALIKLEAIARTKGLAIGTASDLPSNIDRIARFARGLEARGIALVPVSATTTTKDTSDADRDARAMSAQDALYGNYRAGVGIMLLNRAGLVFIGRRRSKRAAQVRTGHEWQMPQGGIDVGEDPYHAALRELLEETNVSSTKLLAETEDWYTYDLPLEHARKSWKGRFQGQRQKWFALRFVGNDDEIDINAPAGGQKPEFDAWRWEDMGRLSELIIPFKQSVYRQVVGAFAHLAG